MIDKKVKLSLSKEEKRSTLWAKLSEHLNERLDSLRVQNDADKSDIETARLRGRIAEVKMFLSLEKDLPDLD